MPSAPLYFPDSPMPDSTARRKFRALARSAPWLSTSLNIEIDIPEELGDPSRGLAGTVTAKLRQREAIAVHNAAGDLVFQEETFSAQRSRDYVAATNSSWKLPSTLITPVYTADHLVLRRPEIAGFNGLMPLDYWAAILDPVEIAGREPAALDLAFDHPTYIHELREISHEGRSAVAAVLSAGHTYQPTLANFVLVPAETRTLLILDQNTGVVLLRQVLTGSEAQAAPDLKLRILAQDEYYINSHFQKVHWLDQPVVRS